VYYRRRQYKKARKAFEQAAAFGPLTDQLRSTFFAAAACSAFAEGDTHGSINLSERSLEFDDNALLARMVKVDAFLRLGKKEAAGEEVLSALRQGLDFELEDKVPLDPEITLRQIFRFQKTAAASAASVSNEDSLLVGRNN
jgi:tetratricopeptide (TPR) repeat protein